jgi:hypothetical protein
MVCNNQPVNKRQVNAMPQVHDGTHTGTDTQHTPRTYAHTHKQNKHAREKGGKKKRKRERERERERERSYLQGKLEEGLRAQPRHKHIQHYQNQVRPHGRPHMLIGQGHTAPIGNVVIA